MESEFLIIGGGIGGAVLANVLTRGGKQVLVLEKSLAPPPLVRPEVLWPATIETLQSILLLGELRKALLPVEGIRFFRSNRPLLSFRRDRKLAADIAGVPCSTDPNLTRQLLLSNGGFQVRRGVSVVGLVRDGSRVVGVRGKDITTGEEVKFRARWIVGDDGAHSVVRDACGLGLRIQAVPLDLLCFGFDWPLQLPPATAHVWINDRWAASGIPLLAAAPLPNGRGAGLIPVRPWALNDPACASSGFQAFLRKNSGAAAVFGGRRFPDDLVRVRTGFGHAPRYGTDGVFLIGDAAHPVTPAGGQGANLAIADAVTLAGLLLRDPDSVLADYESIRRPPAERSLRLSRGARRVLSLPDAILSRIFPTALGLAGLWPGRFAPVLRLTSTAFQSPPSGAQKLESASSASSALRGPVSVSQ